MTVELTAEVTEKLTGEHYAWLTTVAKSGLPVPKLVWFFYDGTDIVVYTMPSAAKVNHIKRHAQVSLNFDSDGTGGGIVVVGGTATIGAEGVDCREDEPYWQKYGAAAQQFGIADTMENYSTKLRISIDKVWTTPEA